MLIDVLNIDDKFEKIITEMHLGFSKIDEKIANIVTEMHAGFSKSDEKFVQVVNRLAEMEGNIRLIMTRLDYKERVDEMEYRLRKVEEL